MKQLKSSIEDFREIFGKGIIARHITKSLCSFDESAITQEAKNILDEKDYYVVRVRTKGVLNGYAYKKDLGERQHGEYFKNFDTREILPDTISISEVLKVIIDFNLVFISSFGNIAGIITRGDLQKIPIRMWLFSLISLMEMQMLCIIRDRYSENSWYKDELISPGRREKVEKLFDERKKKNEEIDWVDCLQFCDKYTIISKTEDILKKLQYDKKKKEFCTLLKELEESRNKLTHAQDIITSDWPNIIDISTAAEEFLKTFEAINDVKNYII